MLFIAQKLIFWDISGAAKREFKKINSGLYLAHQRTPSQKDIYRLSTERNVWVKHVCSGLKCEHKRPNILKNNKNIFFRFLGIYVDNFEIRGYYAPTRQTKFPGK